MQALDTLIRAAKAGDIEAFGTVVERFEAAARATAFGLLGDVQLAEDAAQEAFLEAYCSLAQLREPAAFAGWFRRIVVKRADRLRRGRQLDTVSLEYAAHVGGASDTAALVEARELQRLVHAAVETLSDAERLPLLLFYLAGYSQREIAAMLGLETNAVKQRLWQARRRLRSQFAAQEPAADSFSRAIRFLLAVRTGDVGAVQAYLADDASLANVRERWDDATARRLGLPIAGALTALHRAALEAYPEVLGVLLAYGADSEARTPEQQTALHLGVLAGSAPVVAALLAHGAAADALSATRMSPLHYAAARGRHACAALLLDAGARAELRDCSGRTARDWAVHKLDTQLIRMLDQAAGKTRSAI